MDALKGGVWYPFSQTLGEIDDWGCSILGGSLRPKSCPCPINHWTR